MIRVYFKGTVHYCSDDYSEWGAMEFVDYKLSKVDGVSYKVYNKIADAVAEGSNEQYRCLVDVSYAFSNSSLDYQEYVDWCYNLFNYEQMEELLKSDKIEVVFISEEDDA